jgi:hypothetical protein
MHSPPLPVTSGTLEVIGLSPDGRHRQRSERKDGHAMHQTLVDNTSYTTSTVEVLEYLRFSALVENPRI